VYVNHKPAVDYSEDELLAALGDAFEPGQEGEASLDPKDTTTIKKANLETLLQLYGIPFR
jgi:hypothetical protein